MRCRKQPTTPHDEVVELIMKSPHLLSSKHGTLATLYPRNGLVFLAMKTRYAFSILENAIAASILALVVVGVLAMTSHSFILMQGTREFSRANQILQQKMEDIRLLRFSDIQALPSTFTDPNDSQGKFPGTITKATYRTSLSGTVVSIKVTLSVTWTGRNGKSRTQSMTSVFSNTGLNDYIF